MTTSAAVRIEKINYKGWPNSYRISNGEVELVVTSDVGPRIMRYAFIGGQNLFKEFPEQLGKSGEKEYQMRGGHRLWVAPETLETSWALDNSPVNIEIRGSELTATGPVEPGTGLQKQIVVRLDDTGTGVEVIHRLKNTTPWTLEFAPWAMTMMAPGGTAISGFPPRGKHPEVLAATNPLVMWAYTDLSDKRWTFTKKYFALRNDPQIAEPQKIGTFNPKTWAAYLLGTDLFLKQTTADPARTYPDFGCSFETFTNNEMLEIETLGPLTKVEPGKAAEHTERWSLHKNIRISQWTDAELDRVVGSLLK
ncbi:MAG TPA: hypothetical protein PLK67_12590 [Bryobacteraceae bacterium]|nr:hypothetical protein [Bryobacteraceae bacterium]HOL71669.1 hypothetical protein [Bryobacteraceae bacterium]HOQ44999.1 hypothetical protein [Bryobacteraceae bacterium]